jgi:short-subunit dehydrogenase
VLHGAAEDVPLDAARDQFQVNLFAPARLVQLVLPGMREHRCGAIVNSDTLRMEVERFGVRVVIIQPGIVRTEFEDQTAAQLRKYSGDGAYRHMAEAMTRAAATGLTGGSEPAVVALATRAIR